MLFNSYEFIFLFLPITFFVYFWLNHKRLTYASKAWMVFASLFFYSWWNVIYLPLILSSILFNFAIGSTLAKMEDEQTPKKRISRKAVLTFGVILNIGLLGYYKYMDFFIANANSLFGLHWDLMQIVLPLGISFFTFTQIAYLVDAYRGEVKEMDYLNYTLFVTFFPHLLAGPILHHKEMMPQFDSLKSKVIDYKNIIFGLFLFSVGLFKKVVVADTFAQWSNAGFNASETLNFIQAWTTSLSYTFQLYFDFSGYTDMALGIALLFNIRLPINFNSPYKALSIQDFWRRWHITLSRFLRDYIYIPLGGNRYGEFRTYMNLFAVFLIGGFWHGASWMFVIWGALHGMAIVIHRAWQRLGYSMHWLPAWILTFGFVNLTWIFFRAPEWQTAKNIILGMVGIHEIDLSKILTELFTVQNVMAEWTSLIAIIVAFAVLVTAKNTSQTLMNPFYRIHKLKAVYFAFLAGISLLMVSTARYSEFIYFNF